MNNPFKLKKSQLEKLLAAYSKYIQNNEETTTHIKEKKQLQESILENLFNQDWDNINLDEYYKYIRTKYLNKVDGVFPSHGENRIKDDVNYVKEVIQYIKSSNDDPFTKTEEILNGKYRRKFYARAFWTPILNAYYPDVLPNWNSKTEDALNLLRLELPKKVTEIEKYKQISEAFLFLKNISPELGFIELDHFMHYLVAVEEGKELVKEELNIQKRYWLIGNSDWKDNWDKITDRKLIYLNHSNDLPDLRDYKTKEDVAELLKNTIEESGDNNILSAFQFANEMNIGDVVIVKASDKQLLGYGEVRSEYLYEDKDEYPHQREVIWRSTTPKDYYQIDEIFGVKNFVRKYLTDITKYEGFGEKLIDSLKDSSTESEVIEEKETYSLFLDKEVFNSILNSLTYKKNVILQGPPGVGKTYIAKKLALALTDSKENIETIQFHQSYSYEDFMQGYRPSEDGGFYLKNGIFYELCEKAEQNTDQNFVIIIDEINRGNLSKIFGELMMLIESDKRGDYVTLTYSTNVKFTVPNNLYIIGTMNTADRSIALVDYALRRRFRFFTLEPQFNSKFSKFLQARGIDELTIKKIVNNISELNMDIISNISLGKGFQIGHSYFTPRNDETINNSEEWYADIINHEILPLLEEYYLDDDEAVKGKAQSLLE